MPFLFCSSLPSNRRKDESIRGRRRPPAERQRTCIHGITTSPPLLTFICFRYHSGPDAAALLHTFLLIYRYEPSARYPTLSALNLCCFQEWSLLLLCFMFAFMSELTITYGKNKMKLSEFWLFLPYRLDQNVTPKWFKSKKTSRNPNKLDHRSFDTGKCDLPALTCYGESCFLSCHWLHWWFGLVCSRSEHGWLFRWQ